MSSAPAPAPGVTEARPDVGERDQREVERSIDVPYDVLLWNDPVTLMEVVVRVLKKVFGYDSDRAERLMLIAHQEGKAVVWTGERDRAVRYCLELATFGLQSTVARSV
ncbi:MAG TPA: ATP-dependent Clp protease adaptor ClpS [Acidimicrobiales bacterium]|nr:ATP-dependent Clp protease adaptor ClpS [Acidimicrobiales bacterium]